MSRTTALALILTSALAAGAGVATASTGTPAVTSGVRPGPAILYAPPAKAPQLENVDGWKAEPILISGAHSYRDGEWLYQDFLSDDHGATGSKDPNDPYGISAHLYSPAGGTFTYPTDKVYANNAADLVELRVRPMRSATAFRVTLNTLLDAKRTAFTLALGGGASVAWPHGAGVSSPGTLFVTWHGSAVDAVDAAGKAVAGATAKVDLLRRQVTVSVPHSAINPGAGKLRTSVGVGLWDVDGGTYLKPGTGSATADTPGGGTPNGVAIVNVGPRLDEPLPLIAGATMADTAVGGAALAPWWRERTQSLQLTRGDVTPFAVEVDFGKLARKVRDDSGVPKTGPMNRILASHYSFGQGIDPTKVCFDLAASFNAGSTCVGRNVGQLQPYALYVPAKPVPAKGYGMTLLLHSLSANYNQYSASKNQSQLGDRGAGSLVVTPGGRGPDGFYQGIAEADTFETWADVARHYAVDPDWSVVSGYSMGGFGTYRLLARWPDLFSRGFSVVGEPGSVDDQLVSLRNTPLLAWNSAEDELVNINTSEQAVNDNTAAGIRFEEDKFVTADHLTLAANDEYGPGAAFLGTGKVDRNPYHVTYVVDPREDNAVATAVADHAYWLSGLKTRKAGNGTVDAVSAAFGTTDAPVLGVQPGAGVLTGGEIPAMAYVSRSQQWGPFGKAPKADALRLTVTNLENVTVDVARAGLTCGAKVTVKSDGPVDVVLAGCGKTLHL
ncbi:MAG: putative penicillin acylase [Frankiales bacterium]|nr:putative penicillin acylase [Frankiales bacterium]